jgi:hypothetical protein
MTKTLICIVSCALAAAGCGRATEPAGPVEAQVGDTITLRYGQAAHFDNSVRIVFRAVEEDSRCPVNVTCVWAGDAAIRLDVAMSGTHTGALVLHSHLQPKSGDIGGYVIELVEVAPSRRDPDDVRPTDYSVRLVISRG